MQLRRQHIERPRSPATTNGLAATPAATIDALALTRSICVDRICMYMSRCRRPKKNTSTRCPRQQGTLPFLAFQFSVFITSSDFLLHRLLFFSLVRRRVCSSHVRAGSRKPCMCNRLGDNHTLIADLGVSRQLNPLLRSARADRAAT
jgi:hypothetical protein